MNTRRWRLPLAMVTSALLPRANMAQSARQTWSDIRAAGDSAYAAALNLPTLDSPARSRVELRVELLLQRVRQLPDTVVPHALVWNIERLDSAVRSARTQTTGTVQAGQTAALPIIDASACSKATPHPTGSILDDVNGLLDSCALHIDSMANRVAAAILHQVGDSLREIADAQATARQWDRITHTIQSLYLDYRLLCLEYEITSRLPIATGDPLFEAGRIGLVVNGSSTSRRAIGSIVQWRERNLPRMASNVLAWLPSSDSTRQRVGLEFGTGVLIGRTYLLPGLLWQSTSPIQYGGAVLLQVGPVAVGPSYYTRAKLGARVVLLGR